MIINYLLILSSLLVGNLLKTVFTGSENLNMGEMKEDKILIISDNSNDHFKGKNSIKDDFENLKNINTWTISSGNIMLDKKIKYSGKSSIDIKFVNTKSVIVEKDIKLNNINKIKNIIIYIYSNIDINKENIKLKFDDYDINYVLLGKKVIQRKTWVKLQANIWKVSGSESRIIHGRKFKIKFENMKNKTYFINFDNLQIK